MKTLATTLVAAILLMGMPALSLGEDLTASEIVKGLKPKKLTRSLGGDNGALSEDQKARLENLTRAIGVVPKEEKREKLAELDAMVEAAQLPKLDFAIYFEYDSADIATQSLPTLDQLGAALASPELQGMSYLVNGHTDAKGSDAYNQSLSERRAETVAAYLARHHGIDPTKLKPLGYGESRLKDAADPEAAVNRRVEIVNLTY
jgi:outer membrane protein OmpA-like peptidoglycan-associated protein